MNDLQRGLVRLLLPCFVSLYPVSAAPVQWSGNHHWYEGVAVGVPGIVWADAQAGAVARGGYLATITSAEENAFIYALALAKPGLWAWPTPPNYGPWLGGFQPEDAPEPAGGWLWVTGEPWSYSDWGPGEPNNYPWPDEEDNLHLLNYPDVGVKWNDQSGTAYPLTGYIVEWDTPEPSSLSLVLVGALLFGVRLLRRRGLELTAR